MEAPSGKDPPLSLSLCDKGEAGASAASNADVAADKGGAPLALPIASQHDATATDPARPPRMAAQLTQDSSSGIRGSLRLNARLGAGLPAADPAEALCNPLCCWLSAGTGGA